MNRIFIILSIVITIVLAVSCNKNDRGCQTADKFFEITTPISKLLECPQEYSTKTVKIKGVVSKSIGLNKKCFFVLTDDTGSINVHSDDYIAPAEGAVISIEGRVKQGFSFHEHRRILFEITNNQ